MKVKSIHRSRTIYGTEIMKGRIFHLVGKNEGTTTLVDRKGIKLYVSDDEFDECFVNIN